MSIKIEVGIVMGSKSDLPVMQKAADILKKLEIGCEMRILSAHHTPVQAKAWAESAKERGIKVLICGAGMAASATYRWPLYVAQAGSGASI